MSIAYSIGRGEPRKPSHKEIEEFREWYFNHKLPE